MINPDKKIIEKHIKTHSVQSDDDRSAVSVLQTFLRSNGKINSNFFHGDKWPNIDGSFEFVENPLISRRPSQNFNVQIKGTHCYAEEDGGIKYSLKGLGFPAYIYSNVTYDPVILFLVLNPNKRGEERVFWKYMSMDFVNSINYNNESTTITFSLNEEIKNTEDSINEFCNKLSEITEQHRFMNQLDASLYSEVDIKRIISYCDSNICENIDRFEIYNDTRDNVSKRMLNLLHNLCEAVLLLNLLKAGIQNINIKLAWERSLLSIQTKYLADFYKSLKYIGNRIPADGQSERLMLKYYEFLWQIRQFLKDNYNISILHNLEKFPIDTDSIDKHYYEQIANLFNSVLPKDLKLSNTRYYIQKKTPFFVDEERYYEVTLQLADIYATKYNRITVYTKEDISTDYSIKIGYIDKTFDLWGITSSIRIVTNWQVSINPKCLNKLAKILHIPLSLSSKHSEYSFLMNELTVTGLNFLELIDLQESEYKEVTDKIYTKSKTNNFKRVLDTLRTNYFNNSTKLGCKTIRYLIIDLREDIFENIMPNSYQSKILCNELYLSSKCFPFETNPFISNLVGKKSIESSINKLIDIAGVEKYQNSKPYLKIKSEIDRTGEIYFNANTIVSDEEINNFNSSLNFWEQNQGYKININGSLVSIDAFEFSTLKILNHLLKFSKQGIKGQEAYNRNYLKNCSINFTDPLKKQALKDIFVNSQIMLLYGAAGTGKTTLINYISNMLVEQRKLFLTKTHTALQNLKRRIEYPGQNADFISLDSFTKRVNLPDYDIIFIDECSTIDNRIMCQFLDKIKENTLLVMAGDIYQIESINFGNWFLYAKDIIKTQGANVELIDTWRTNDQSLKDLWNEVRCKKDLITEKLVINGPYSENLGPNILNRYEEDEVILCLNYDGKFGLNNMNNYFQNANQNPPVSWQEWVYKKGDYILFNDNRRFSVLYNNLKGTIFDVKKDEEGISFIIDVDIILTEATCIKDDIDFISIIDDKKTRIHFKVYNPDDSDENPEISHIYSIIPFQLAYAVSIHKAQGLEYDSVKLIIPNNNSEKITHGIFYTAITRAKKNLKIFWSSETMQKIIKSFSINNSKLKSLEYLKSQL